MRTSKKRVAARRAMALSVAVYIGSAIAQTGVCSGSTLDTLRSFDRASASAYYRDPAITAQAARFDLRAPARIRRLGFLLGGAAASGSARVSIYGNEAGLPAPLVGAPAGRQMIIRKTRAGVEHVTLELSDELFISEPQFFVVVEDLSPGVVLLSDGREKRPTCADGGERWLHQALRTSDGRWHNGRYGFAIEAVVEYPSATSPSYLADVTAQLGLADEPAANRSIAWGDIDGDGWADLLSGGRLYRNLGGASFRDVTEASGIAGVGTPTAHAIGDLDADGDLDLLFLAISRDEEVVHLTFVNDGRGSFEPEPLDLPSVVLPSTVTLADANLDGTLDLFVGQALDGRAPGAVLILNDGRRRLREVSTPVFESSQVTAAQWIDHDADGDPDLFTAGSQSSSSRLWLNDGRGAFVETTLPGAADDRTAGAADLADANADGRIDLLQPLTFDRERLDEIVAAPGGDHGSLDVVAMGGNRYRHWNAGATWADVNNDGLLDALVTGGCDCRYATLFLQQESGRFDDASFEYGLFRVPAGADAVWIDYDGDGRLDLSTFVAGQLRLLRNTAHTGARSVTVDLGNGTTSPTAQVTAHIGDRTIVRHVVSGRGSLMQAPPTVHFGLGGSARVDSIVIRLAGAERPSRTVSGEDAGAYYRLDGAADVSTGQASASLAVMPNPFTTTLTFHIDLEQSSDVRIELYSPDGRLVAVPLDARRDAGRHDVSWNPLDVDGRRLPQGMYTYRLSAGTTTLTGRVLHVH